MISFDNLHYTQFIFFQETNNVYDFSYYFLIFRTFWFQMIFKREFPNNFNKLDL
jgi:hypothetical protein